jgi:hypothetical protein
MIRRSGTTLVEVLVAIFVMAIGLLAIMSLFPLGALSMAQAIKDDRTAHAEQDARAIANFWNIRQDPNVINAWATAPAPYASPSAQGPSYPVYVDPRGMQAIGQQPDPRVGTPFLGMQPSAIRRVTLSWITTPQQIARWFSLPDDITFDQSGVPNPAGPLQIDRANLYTWAYLLRQEQYGQPSSPVDLSVVVYERRAPVAGLGGTLQGENMYSAIFQAGSNVATLTWNTDQDPPKIRNGSWILDAYMSPNDVHGFFYRVVNVTDTSSGSMDLELQTNAKATASQGVAVVMDDVAEVFDIGPN